MYEFPFWTQSTTKIKRVVRFWPQKKILILTGGTGDYTAQTIIVLSANRGRGEKQLLETITLDPVTLDTARRERGDNTRTELPGISFVSPLASFFSFLIPTISRPKSPPGTRTHFIIAMYFPDERGRLFIVTVFFFFLIKNRKHVVGREYRRRPLPTSCVYIFQHHGHPRAAQIRHRAINNTQIRFNKSIKRLNVSARPSPSPPQFAESPPSNSICFFLHNLYTSHCSSALSHLSK